MALEEIAGTVVDRAKFGFLALRHCNRVHLAKWRRKRIDYILY